MQYNNSRGANEYLGSTRGMVALSTNALSHLAAYFVGHGISRAYAAHHGPISISTLSKLAIFGPLGTIGAKELVNELADSRDVRRSYNLELN